jgi:hypothetical protein
MWLPLVMYGVSIRALQWHSKCCYVASVTKTFTLKGYPPFKVLNTLSTIVKLFLKHPIPFCNLNGKKYEVPFIGNDDLEVVNIVLISLSLFMVPSLCGLLMFKTLNSVFNTCHFIKIFSSNNYLSKYINLSNHSLKLVVLRNDPQFLRPLRYWLKCIWNSSTGAHSSFSPRLLHSSCHCQKKFNVSFSSWIPSSNQGYPTKRLWQAKLENFRLNRFFHDVTYYFPTVVAHGRIVGWGTTLQVWRSQVRIPNKSLIFCSMYLILLVALWPLGLLSL